MPIDTSTRLTRVKNHLLDYINASQLAQGDRLPSEADMAKTLGVSRNTIREAYITLEAEGTIVRRHGIGTFVSRPPKIKEPILDEMFGFPHYITSAGYDFDFKLISVEHVLPTKDIHTVLGGEMETAVLQAKHLQYANNIPTTYLTDNFSAHVDETKFNWDKFDGRMLEFVSDSLGILERQMHTRIQAVTANADVAHHLSLPEGTPILNICSSVFTMEGKPITYSVIYLNPNNIELEVSRIYRHKK